MPKQVRSLTLTTTLTLTLTLNLTLSQGFLMRRAFELAYSTAYLAAGYRVMAMVIVRSGVRSR